jgi:hypothetical protein
MYLVLAGFVVAALLVVGAITLAQSTPWKDRSAGPSTASSTPAATTGPTVARGVAAAFFENTSDSMNDRRAEFVSWLKETAPASPQLDVDAETDKFVAGENADLRELARGNWPPAVRHSISALVEADRRFVEDLDNLHYGQQGTPSYISLLVETAGAIDAADDAVRRQLGLPVSSQ